MANETTLQSSCIKENLEADECQENVVLEYTAAAGRIKGQVDVDEYSFTKQSKENKPLPDNCNFSTPAPKSTIGEVKAKSRLSGLQSALTPMLKILNIGNKCPSPKPVKPVKPGNSPELTCPFFTFNRNTANYQKSAAGSGLKPNADLSRGHLGRSLGDKDASVCWLDNEYLPEITLLDLTCDSTMQLTRNDSALPDSAPATPVTTRSVNGALPTHHHMHLNSSTDFKAAVHKPCCQNKIVDPLQSEKNFPKVEAQTTDPASSVAINATATLHVTNQNNVTGVPSGLNDVKNITFEGQGTQKSSEITITGEATKCTFESKTSKSSSESKQSKMEEATTPKTITTFPFSKHNNLTIQTPKLLKSNWTAASTNTDAMVVDTPARANAPLRWLDDRFFPEITLLDVTHDSELSPAGEMSAVEVSQDFPPCDDLKIDTPSIELCGENVTQPNGLDITQSKELSSPLSTSVAHTVSASGLESEKCAEENVMKVSLTQDTSMDSVLEDAETSKDPSEQNMGTIQMSAEDTLGTHPANVTHDISLSSNMSAKSADSQLSTSDMQVNVTSKNVSSELHGEAVEGSINVEAQNEQLPANYDTGMTSTVVQHSPETGVSANNTFSIAQSSPNASINVNTTTQISPPLSNTLDLSPNAKSDEVNNDKEDCSVSKIITETPLKLNESNSADKTDVQYTTFDQHSVQKSRESTGLQEAAIQNNTFDSKPASKQNGTITFSETSSNDSHQTNLDKFSPSKVCNTTTSPKDSNSEGQPPELSKNNGTITSTDHKVHVSDNPQVTFETSPENEIVSEGGDHNCKDQSQQGLSMTVGFSDTLGHQNMDTGNNKVDTFNLDETLDLRADSLITSTPMPNCKMFSVHTERDDGKILGAQKKLYGDGPAKPVVQVQSDVPSNIVCDRKTFFTQPAAKSLLPPLKSTTQLLKHKPASTIPGRIEPSSSGLPMTRQRTQALRSTAAPESAHGTTGISSSYNFRATTTGSKQPVSGLPRPQMTGIPTSIQRAAPSLRPPVAKSNAPASSSADKLRAPTITATNPLKMSQVKKHHLIKGESLPTAKRKKMEVPLSSSNAEASESSCDAANGTKILKHSVTSQKSLPTKRKKDDAAIPASNDETAASCDTASKIKARKQPATIQRALLQKPQSHDKGCTKCVELQGQLKIQSEEILKLKEELQKYIKQEEKC